MYYIKNANLEANGKKINENIFLKIPKIYPAFFVYYIGGFI